MIFSENGGFMNQIWDGRRTTIALPADVGRKESLSFIMAALGERGYAQLRGSRPAACGVAVVPIRSATASPHRSDGVRALAS